MTSDYNWDVGSTALTTDALSSSALNWSYQAIGGLDNASSTTAGGGGGCDIEINGFFEFFIYGILLNIISFLGLLGNAISMIVLSRPQMKSSINCLLIGLATCDTVLILLSVSFVHKFYTLFNYSITSYMYMGVSNKIRIFEVALFPR